ncbi:ArnT family glycosyltransferase [Singulisphaera acidiphila]|uniref:PMT family glycosyltransferase, 4-amino-4-deoxy-L-arabinose transferase n=1 Tax=Singulisphaera acidiphila (strain ATCC BAA-1392 / DSM 18658 / VKM B-2454 / MOB10) TaxID=886293 RepID=L0DDL1_SINAD|nr:glycosyltransferase family 39 protein [Singulisphaera acidiphila]AGA27342.1 PMT family glycosyltransferase, 4-amino-4-deoxy-L-arabinose transferase [Singulisphaera acidiphila DSM 18658]
MAPTSLPPIFGTEACESRRRLLLEPVLIGLLALTLNLAGNHKTSLWDRDEPRYSACVREMRARGDWIRPTFNGEPRYHKPILIYWLMRGGVALGGDNPFGCRLVSAIAGVGTCLLVRAMGRRMLGPQMGMFAALMLATSPIMVTESKLATTDATLAFWLVGAQFCLWELAQRPSRRLAAGFWTLMALATLTKGPVGAALIAMSGIVSWWWGGPTACWSRLRWRWGLCVFLAVVAPWLVMIGLVSHGEFFRFAIGDQIIQRVATGMEKHTGFPGYYLVTTLGTFHPWSALLPAALFGAWSRRREHPLFGFLLGWAVGPLILLECVQTKLVHYYLPAIPACALLAAWLIALVVKEEVNLRRWPLGRVGVGLLSGTAVVLLGGLIAGATMLPTSLRSPLLFLAVILVSGTTYAVTRIFCGLTERAVGSLVVTWAIFMFAMGTWLLPAAEPYRTSRIVGERFASLAKEHRVQPILNSYQEPSVIYAYGRPLPTVRNWSQVKKLVLQHGAVATAVLPHELSAFLARPEYEVERLDHLTGFNLNKGENESLEFILLRMHRSVRVTGLKQSPVK